MSPPHPGGGIPRACACMWLLRLPIPISDLWCGRLPSVRVLRPNNPYKHLKTPPTSKVGANRPSLRSPACGKDSALALWREVGVGEKQGIQESPGSHTGKKKKKTNVRLGESERTAALASLAIFAERAGCPRMHSSGPAVVSPCCFANTNYKDWQYSPTPLPPRTPRSWAISFWPCPLSQPSVHQGYLQFGCFFSAQIWVG